MTPKEKAENLVNNYCNWIGTWSLNSNFSLLDIAKQCALIAVDEIIKTLKPPCLTEFDYWQQVKQEIENL